MEGLQEGQDSDLDARSEHSPLSRLRRWREHVRSRRTTRLAYKSVVGLIGGGIVVGGLLLVPLPGPGWAIVILGLLVLASEFVWASKVLEFLKRVLQTWTHWLGRQPLAIRLLVGVATFAFVAFVLYLLFRISGVPGWVPDSWVEPIPGLEP